MRPFSGQTDQIQEANVSNLQIAIAIEALYVASTSLVRISILLFYRRMASGSISKPFLWTVRSVIAFVIAYFFVFEMTLFLNCRPFNAFWNEVNPLWAATHKYSCISEAGNLVAASIISVIQDFIVCFMPTILFWKLQLPRKQKVALGAIFGIGFLLCIAGVLRIYYIYSLFFSEWAPS